VVYLPPLIEILACLKAERSSNGLVVQLVRIPACHAGGREFESRPDRNTSTSSVIELSEVETKMLCCGT
jgi:hypothetical protein